MAVIHAGMPKRPGIFPVTATLGALGVVYGDIGTSPLYALKEAARAAAHGGTVTPDAVLGIVSLILWALILIISIKYALLILRADNHGEGGIVALLALLSARNAEPGTWRARLLVVVAVVAGVCVGHRSGSGRRVGSPAERTGRPNRSAWPVRPARPALLLRGAPAKRPGSGDEPCAPKGQQPSGALFHCRGLQRPLDSALQVGS